MALTHFAQYSYTIFTVRPAIMTESRKRLARSETPCGERTKLEENKQISNKENISGSDLLSQDGLPSTSIVVDEITNIFVYCKAQLSKSNPSPERVAIAHSMMDQVIKIFSLLVKDIESKRIYHNHLSIGGEVLEKLSKEDPSVQPLKHLVEEQRGFKKSIKREMKDLGNIIESLDENLKAEPDFPLPGGMEIKGELFEKIFRNTVNERNIIDRQINLLEKRIVKI